MNKIQTEKNVSNIDKDLFREIKNDWTQSINQINELNSELEKLRREKRIFNNRKKWYKINNNEK